MRSALFVLLVSILLSIGFCIGNELGPVTSEQSLKSSTLALSAANKNEDPEPTSSVTEGPYFKSNSPERRSLIETGIVGERLNLTGHVLTRSGRPVAGALLDFWQADGNGVYDLTDYKLRGHQYTDDQGRYQLETVVPGIYPGRTRHIHVKVQAPNGTVLTTQLFFPDEAGNQRDSIFNPKLLMDITNTTEGKRATFDFVLDIV